MFYDRFIKFIYSPEADYLQEFHPNAFLLLSLIARRARRIPGQPDGLEIGEAFIGDYKKAGIETEMKYRVAKKVLEKRKHIKIIETCRNRKNATTTVTTVGTKVKLLKSTIWDINPESNNDRHNDRITTEQRPDNEEQERKRKNKNEKEEQHIAQPASRLRIKDAISFNFSSFQFEGISLEDLKSWSELYPHITVNLEITKAIQWLKSNPTKSGKKLWRKFLTGWFQRSNDSIENKKAYQTASANNLPKRIDNESSKKPSLNGHEGHTPKFQANRVLSFPSPVSGNS